MLGLELDPVKTTESGCQLILATHILFDHFLFNVNGLHGQPLLWIPSSPKGVKGVKEADSKSGTRAKT